MTDRAFAAGLEWGDLAVLLAIGRAESLIGASRLLGVSHTTVYRRVNPTGGRAGGGVFWRLPNGYAKTDAGEVAMGYAERIEGELLALSREILGRDTKLQGKVVLTAPDGVVSQLLPPVLAAFQREHPDVVIELLEGVAAADLARREADIAIRATRQPPDASLGRRIGAFAFAPYASPEYLTAHPSTPLAEHRYVAFGDSLSWLVPRVWKTQERADARVVMRTNSTTGAVECARAGMGVVLMSCYRCDPLDGLVRVTPPLEHLTLELWILTHPALRHTARVKVLMDHLTKAMREHAPLFDGTSVE